MNRWLIFVVVAGVVAAALGWVLTAPDRLDEAQIAALPEGNPVAGEMVFWAGGCASCHAAPKSGAEAKMVLSGGAEFATPFGTFVAPNISPDTKHGIGAWSLGDFANAMKRGVRPDGAHYYPAFPYASYARVSDQDISDLWAFMQTLPKVATSAKNHALSFPFNVRRGLGLWKLLYVDPSPVVDVPQNDAVLVRGRYLVEGLAHCGECHTPRNLIGGPDHSRWMAGGKSPEGNETIPNITPHRDGIGSWSVKDIANALETGFTPEFDSFGSSMADVQFNMSKIPANDRAAIAAYLKQVKPLAKPY